MKEIFWQIFKLVFFAFLILTLQIAVLKEITDIAFNLPLVAIITVASFSSLEISIYNAGIFIAAISLLSYDSTIYWAYLVVAFITNEFNPKNLEDKFLIAAFYCTIFTPLFEVFYAPVKENLLNKCVVTTLINLATLIPIYFVLKLALSQKTKVAY